MDPKMDSGFLEPGDTLEETYDMSRDLLPEEVIGIIDQLLCLEVGFPFLSDHCVVLVCIRASLVSYTADMKRWLGTLGIRSHRRSSPMCMLTAF